MHGHSRPLLVALVALFPSMAVAQQPLTETTYFCTTEMAGGLAFSTTAKRWEPATFRPTHKFVLKVKYHRVREEANSFEKSGKSIVFDVEASVTDAGTSTVKNCHPMDGSLGHIEMRDHQFHCEAILMQYRFNLLNNRFLKAYLQGYVEGPDNNEDTPSISGGTCTKI